MFEFTYGFPPLQQALQNLSKLEDSQFEVLRREVTGRRGFARNLERCENIAAELKSSLTPRDVFNILTSLQFLYDSARRWEKSEGGARAGLHEFFQFTGLGQNLGSLGSTCYERLEQLIKRNPDVELRRKRRRLKTGLIDTAVDFASFVDLRPSFNEDRSAIQELIPVVILRIALKSEYGPDRSCVFQMSADSVAKLHSALTDIDNKLEALRSDDAFNSRLELTDVDDRDDGDD